MFKVCVISADGTLMEACRATLDQLCPEQYDCQLCQSSGAPAGYDIYVWDSASIPDLAACLATPGDSTKLVIVPKESLAALQNTLPHRDFVFLRSPATRLTLRVFLESTVARLELDRGTTSRPLALNRDQILQKLLETNLKLQEYDRERTNFLTRAVHDIRVPLMAIQGYCGLLLAGQVGAVLPEQARILERMQRSLTRLGGLASAMMDLGIGSQAPLRLNLESASLEASVNQALYEILPFAEQKHINVNVTIDPPSGLLLFDAGYLEQVLVNLLDNACKFTPKHGSIEVHGYSIDSEEVETGSITEIPVSGYRIDVCDTGPGIRPEYLERIFNEYTSFGGPEDRSGAGLGLAICRMMINAHNGRIWASSDEGGAKFSLVLPYLHTHAEQAVAAQVGMLAE